MTRASDIAQATLVIPGARGPPNRLIRVSPLGHPLLLDADVVVVLLRNSRDDLESCARLARTLAGDVNWQSDAVRHVYERMDGIERRLEQLAAGTDAAIADIHAAQRRYLAGLALLGA